MLLTFRRDKGQWQSLQAPWCGQSPWVSGDTKCTEYWNLLWLHLWLDSTILTESSIVSNLGVLSQIIMEATNYRVMEGRGWRLGMYTTDKAPYAHVRLFRHRYLRIMVRKVRKDRKLWRPRPRGKITWTNSEVEEEIFKLLHCIWLTNRQTKIVCKLPINSIIFAFIISCDSTYNLKQHYSRRKGTIKSWSCKPQLFHKDIYLAWKNGG